MLEILLAARAPASTGDWDAAPCLSWLYQVFSSLWVSFAASYKSEIIFKNSRKSRYPKLMINVHHAPSQTKSK